MAVQTLSDQRILLRADGAAILLDLTGGRLPAILHWGDDLGSLTAVDAADLADATRPGPQPNGPADVGRVTVLPEEWTGWTGRPGLSGSRRGGAWSPRFTTTAVTVREQGPELVGGPELTARPAQGSAMSVSEGSETAVAPLSRYGIASVEISAADEIAQLGLTIWIELLPGGAVRMRATLINNGAGDYQLDDLVLAYPVPSDARELLDFAGRWGKERTPQRQRLGVGTHLREGRRGRTGADAATVLHLGTPGFGFADGKIWGVHTGWSGTHTHYAERLATGVQVIGGGELLFPGELILENGQSYTSPWLYGSQGIGLDAVARRFHRYLRSRPQHVDTDRPVTLNVWEAVYFNHSLPKLVELAERAAEIGVERYVLDDGWFGARRNDRAGLGDWTVSEDVWPDGLHPLVDKVKELGMQFGLWFEPEMINMDSEVARAHPEWVMATGDRLPLESRYQQVINLGIPACYDYVKDAISRMLDEYRIDYIKWDHNRDLIDAGTQPGGAPGVHDQTVATYRLMDELKQAHPGLEIESCSSGGARVDLGILQRTDRVWVSDCIDPLDRQQMNRWTTQLIPPELMGSHIASPRSHTTGRRHDLSFRAATALWGHLGIEWDITAADDDERGELKSWVEFFKAERGLLLGGDLVRVDHPDEALMAHGVVAPDRSRGLYSLAMVDRSEVNPIGLVRLPGLDPERRYRVSPVIIADWPQERFLPGWWSPGKPYVDLTGRSLQSVGIQTGELIVEHAVILRVDPLD